MRSPCARTPNTSCVRLGARELRPVDTGRDQARRRPSTCRPVPPVARPLGLLDRARAEQARGSTPGAERARRHGLLRSLIAIVFFGAPDGRGGVARKPLRRGRARLAGAAKKVHGEKNDHRRGDGVVSLWITEAEVVAPHGHEGGRSRHWTGLLGAGSPPARPRNMVKTHAVWGGHHTLHAIGATFPDEGFVGHQDLGACQRWRRHCSSCSTATNGVAQGRSSRRFALGQLRTGRDQRGLATKISFGRRRLRYGADRHRQAGHDAARRGCGPWRPACGGSAHSARDGTARGAEFVGRARKALGLNVEEASSVAQAVDGAGIVTLGDAPRDPRPSSRPAMVAAGTHVKRRGRHFSPRAHPSSSRRCSSRCAAVVADQRCRR